MQEKIFEFKVTQSLTAARRDAIVQHIDENAHRSPWPISYSWNGDTLHLMSQPMNLDVIFSESKIDVFRDCPFWARMLLTKKMKEEMQGSAIKVLKDLGFFE